MNNKHKTKKSLREGQCPHYKKCGGCQLQNMSYDKQLEWKNNLVIKLLHKYGRVNNIIGMKNPYNYRNKVSAAFSVDRSGRIVSGVYQASTHNVVPVNKCMIEDKKADEIIVSIRNLIKDFKIQPYNEFRNVGLLRHVLIKRGFDTNEIMVVLVTIKPILPAKNNFVKALLKLHPEITTIIQNVNSKRTSMILGEQEKILYGNGTIIDNLCGCKFRISAKSFYQINPVQTETLYNKAIEFAGLSGKETILDAYCGIGTIGIIASKYAKNVIGVELNREAVRDAILNAKFNSIKNIYFYNADAGEFMVNLANENENIDVVFMDPPRAGSDIKFLSSVVTLSPKKVVYISCNPETLQRDLEYLTSHGYKVKKIQPVDMFPHTNHVETVVLMMKCGFEGKK